MAIARFVTKRLTYENRDKAVNEEVIVDEILGDLYIKSPDGHLISDEEVVRRKNEIQKASVITSRNNLRGELYFMDSVLRRKKFSLDTAVNLLDTPFQENMDDGVSINIIQDA